MRNIENFLQNNKYFDERFWGEDAMTFTIKENPLLCLHIYNGYINSIHDNPLTDEKGRWIGCTRDDNEFIRTYSGYPVEIDLDEYIKDLLLYRHIDHEKQDVKETQEVYDLLLSFLLFARETKQTVVVEND